MQTPNYEKLSNLLYDDDIAIVKQAFEDVADKSETDKRVFGQMLEDIPFVKKGNRHKHCLAMLEVANPSKEEKALQKQLRNNIIAWKWEYLEELQNEFDTLKKQNKINEAIETGQELLQQSIDLKGEKHHDTAIILNDLGTVLQDLEKYEDAEKQLERLQNEFITLKEQNKLNDALKAGKRLFSELMELDHIHDPSLASVARNLIFLINKVEKKHKNKNKDFIEILEASEAISLTTKLEQLYQKQGYRKARRVRKRILTTIKKLSHKKLSKELDLDLVLGPLLKLTLVEKQQRNYKTLTRLLKLQVAATKKLYGEEHPKTLDATLKLTKTLSQYFNHHRHATRVLTHLLKTSKKINGETHAQTFEIMRALAQEHASCKIYKFQWTKGFQRLPDPKHMKQANEIMLRLLLLAAKEHGKENYEKTDAQDIIESAEIIKIKERDFESAYQICNIQLLLNLNSYGETHPTTINNIINLAFLSRYTDRTEQAKNLMEKIDQFFMENTNKLSHLQEKMTVARDFIYSEKKHTKKETLKNFLEKSSFEIPTATSPL